MAKSQSIIRKCGVVNFETQEIQKAQKAQNRLLEIADELSTLYDMQYDYPTLSEGRATICAKINNLVNEKFDIHFALAHAHAHAHIHQQEATI